MDTSSIIKVGIFAVAGYLLYEWLQKSGLWAQYFGGVAPGAVPAAGLQSFATADALTAYCKANPSSSATYGGVSSTCPTWMQTPATSPASSAPPTTGQQPAAPQVDTALADQLTHLLQQSNSRPLGTVSEWNWLYTHLKNDPNAPIIEGDTQFGTSQITAVQYLQARTGAGLSGIGWYHGSFVQRPLRRYIH